MPNIKMPDGVVVRFPDEMPAEQIKSLILQKFPDIGGSAPKPGMFGNSTLDTFHDATTGAGQGVSLDFKDELLAGMATPFRAGYRAIAGGDEGRGIGERLSGAYDTELANQRNILHGAKERSPGATMTGEIIGGLATGGKVAAGSSPVKATYPAMIGRGAAQGAGYGAAYGFGSGEGTEDRIGQAVSGATVGGLTGGALGAGSSLLARRAAKKEMPATSHFEQATGDIYEKLDQLGPFDPQDVSRLMTGLQNASQAARISPKRHQEAISLLEDMGEDLQVRPPTFSELDVWRRDIRDELVANPKTRRVGKALLNEFDDFMNTGIAGPMAKEARTAHRTFKQVELFEDAINNAERTAKRYGRNFDTQFRVQVQQLLRADEKATRKKRPTQFDQETLKQMDAFANGGKLQNFLGWLGKASPESGLGMLGHMLAGISTGGSSLAYQIPIGMASYAAKKGSEGIARRNIDVLQRIITKSGDPMVSARARALIEKLTQGSVAGRSE
jgi:hypothetical protein